jgi:hypothetical protein
MGSLITAAVHALAKGDVLGALNWGALRDGAPALALRGIAMAQLGDLVRAKALLRSATRAFGPKEAVARVRCIVAEAEIALVSRDLPSEFGNWNSGLAWAEGSLWVGQHRGRKIHQIDPQTGTILRTMESNWVVHWGHLDRRRALARHLGR